jgi:hypothetical protein
MVEKPKIQNKEMEKLEKQFDAFSENVEQMTLDRMNAAPKLETEPQTKLSQQDIAKSSDLYLKPNRTISSREKFNEKFRDEYNFKKEYVLFIAENKEVIGEAIEIWTKDFPGVPCEFWKVPTNKPVWGPRYLAENISKRQYHRLIMQQNIVEQTGMGHFYGQLAVDTIVPRLDARPVSTQKSVFMSNFK